MRKYFVLAIDLVWVALSLFTALILRDNFIVSFDKFVATTPYLTFSIAAAGFVFPIAGTDRSIWRYFSLPDAIRIVAATMIVVLLALSAAFVQNRLEGVARSIPVMHWILLVCGMVGTRVLVRLFFKRVRRQTLAISQAVDDHAEQVLVVGLNDVADYYVRAVCEFAAGTIEIVGFLVEEPAAKGRSLQAKKVLGAPEELDRVLAVLKVHGVTVSRVVLAMPFKSFSARSRTALLAAERSGLIKLELLSDRLGLTAHDGWETGQRGPRRALDVETCERKAVAVECNVRRSCGTAPRFMERKNSPSRHGAFKRMIDVVGAIALIIISVPVVALVALVVTLDVGLPVVFWQQRPGLGGRPFRLYKFRTMRGLHDESGHRRSDKSRSSAIGWFLRRSRLDELPQLWNVLIGEMSFVGPRPLLACDLASDPTVRLTMRPGITGWAQVHGGRGISIDEKDALDRWYVGNASLWLDVKIMLKTIIVVVRGDREEAPAMGNTHAETSASASAIYWAANDDTVADQNDVGISACAEVIQLTRRWSEGRHLNR